MSSQQIEACFNEFKSLRKLQKIIAIIDTYKAIKEPLINPLQKQQTKKECLAQQAPFAPAPQLLKSYQQTFSKANQDQRITNTKNYKLEANFSTRIPQKNQIGKVIDTAKIRQQCVLIEDRENILLEQLRLGKIQATIPQMDQTLFSNELSHLQQKQVVIENTLPLSEWKKLRSRFGS